MTTCPPTPAFSSPVLLPSFGVTFGHFRPLPTCSPSYPRRSTLSMTAFRKYHGLGNDFVLVDNRSQSTPLLTADQSVTICDRHRGIGADGVIFLLPPEQKDSDCGMRLYNSDGSEPEMCGNGIRCLAKFARDVGMKGKEHGKFIVDTGAGVIVPEMVGADVCVDMGNPILEAHKVPTKLKGGESVGFKDMMEVAGREWEMTCVSMGNPHAITFVDERVYKEVDERLEEIGPLFEGHEVFPAKTNTEFVYVRGATELDMVVWERGAGRTMACGTGACAVVVAAVLRGFAKKGSRVTVHLPGGDLHIVWEESGKVLMTGPAEFVFEGKVDV